MSESATQTDVVAEAREALKNKKVNKFNYSLKEEQIDEDFAHYTISIDVKIKKNGRPIEVKPDVLNWAGNILASVKP